MYADLEELEKIDPLNTEYILPDISSHLPSVKNATMLNSLRHLKEQKTELEVMVKFMYDERNTH